MKTKLISLLGLPLFCTGSQAAVLFSDNFNRDNSRNIDASLSGIIDNTGSSLSADGVYTHAFIDPNNAPPTYGVQDGVAPNGGGAQILNSTLQLAVGAGTSNAFVNHNFINAAIIAAGGFSVSVDLAGYAGTTAGQGGGFGIGMSLAEAMATGDAISGISKMQDGFVDGVFNTAAFVSVAEFWIVLRGNNTLAWGGAGNAYTDSTADTALFGTASVGAKLGSLTVDFTGFSDFNAGTIVDYAISFNGAPVIDGTGSFAWSDTNANYIGLDSRDGTAVSFDNFSVVAVPEPSAMLLGLLGALGLLRRRR